MLWKTGIINTAEISPVLNEGIFALQHEFDICTTSSALKRIALSKVVWNKNFDVSRSRQVVDLSVCKLTTLYNLMHETKMKHNIYLHNETHVTGLLT